MVTAVLAPRHHCLFLSWSKRVSETLLLKREAQNFTLSVEIAENLRR